MINRGIENRTKKMVDISWNVEKFTCFAEFGWAKNLDFFPFGDLHAGRRLGATDFFQRGG